jgi:hypothetical protein
MFGKARALGLALAAIFTVGALAASAAQAVPTFTGYETEGETHNLVHTIGQGTTEPEGIVAFTAGPIGVIECHGESAGTSLTGEDTELTGAPTFSDPETNGLPDCKTNIGGTKYTTHINMNGCEFHQHASKKIAENEYEGTIDVKCPMGKSIEIKTTKLGSEETKCAIKVGAQNGLGPGFARNKKESKPTEITIESKISNIEYTSEGGLFNCGTSNGKHSGGTLTGTAIAQGFNTEGKQIDIEISGE